MEKAGSEKVYYQAIYPDADGEGKQLLIVQENGEKFMELELFQPFQNALVFSKEIPLTPNPLNFRNLTCDEAYEDFGDCIDCAIAELQDDTLSNLTCILAAWGPCVAAAIIHCL